MTVIERMAPIWPTADLEATRAFWDALGFSSRSHAGAYLVLWRDPVAEIHFYLDAGHVPAASENGAYLRIADVDAIHAEWSMAGLPTEGLPRLTPIEDRSHGLREFALIDCNGHLLKVGTPMDVA